eukprot:scaffold116775_cov63-Phaeocystis_antarctica.AAC.1
MAHRLVRTLVYKRGASHGRRAAMGAALGPRRRGRDPHTFGGDIQRSYFHEIRRLRQPSQADTNA